MKILFVDFTTGLSTIDDLKTRARGGMVSSLFLVPDALSKLNNDVAVWSDVQTSGTTEKGVRWHTVEDYDDVVRQRYDFLVLNRGIGNGLPEIQAKHRILWTHDLVHGGHAPNPEYLRSLSATVFMSRYAEWIWRIYYPQIGKSFRLPNGVDRKLFHPREKDLNYLIFISAPNRGLNRLGMIYQTVKEKTGLQLYMKAFSNMDVLHPHDREARNFIPHEDGGEGFGTKYLPSDRCGVQIFDPLPQTELAEELGKAGLMILPTGYPEICSNAVLQSLASGTPIVTTDLGSVPEWVKHQKNGFLTQTRLEDYTVCLMEMMRATAEILRTEKIHREMIKNAENTKGIYTWEQIGTLWHNMLTGLY